MNNQVIRIEDYFPDPELTGPSEFNDLPLSEQHDTVERMIATLTAMKGAIELLGTELNQCERRTKLGKDGNPLPPKELAPTKDMYIQLHGPEAFDKVKREGKAPTELVWFK